MYITMCIFLYFIFNNIKFLLDFTILYVVLLILISLNLYNVDCDDNSVDDNSVDESDHPECYDFNNEDVNLDKYYIEVGKKYCETLNKFKNKKIKLDITLYTDKPEMELMIFIENLLNNSDKNKRVKDFTDQ